MEDEFRSITIDMSRGDSIFIYTDCMVESWSPDGKPYEETGILHALENAKDGTAGEILSSVMDDFTNYVQKDEYSDDLTAIVVKRL